MAGCGGAGPELASPIDDGRCLLPRPIPVTRVAPCRGRRGGTRRGRAGQGVDSAFSDPLATQSPGHGSVSKGPPARRGGPARRPSPGGPCRPRSPAWSRPPPAPARVPAWSGAAVTWRRDAMRRDAPRPGARPGWGWSPRAAKATWPPWGPRRGPRPRSPCCALLCHGCALRHACPPCPRQPASRGSMTRCQPGLPPGLRLGGRSFTLTPSSGVRRNSVWAPARLRRR